LDQENALINCAHSRQAVLVCVVVPKMTCQDATQARNARQHKESAKDSNHGLVPFDATATALVIHRKSSSIRARIGRCLFGSRRPRRAC
jgi:hypothetical protein